MHANIIRTAIWFILLRCSKDYDVTFFSAMLTKHEATISYLFKTQLQPLRKKVNVTVFG